MGGLTLGIVLLNSIIIMISEETKGAKQPAKAKPKLHTTKACIVSMEYSIKNEDKTPKLDPLSLSNDDAEKVNRLFTKTLGWD
jgi:hypothetical protein